MHLYDNTPHPSTTQKIVEPICAIGMIALILLAIHILFTYGLPMSFKLWDTFSNLW